MRCDEIRELLPAYVSGDTRLVVRRHLSRCSACAAELELYESLQSSLARLADVSVEPPIGLLSTLQQVAETGGLDFVRAHLVRNRRAYLGGLAAAAAGAAVAGAVWRNRVRRPIAA